MRHTYNFQISYEQYGCHVSPPENQTPLGTLGEFD